MGKDEEEIHPARKDGEIYYQRRHRLANRPSQIKRIQSSLSTNFSTLKPSMTTSPSPSPLIPRTPSTASVGVPGERKASWTPQTRNPVSLRLLSDLYATPSPPPSTTSNKGKESELQQAVLVGEDGDDELVLHDGDMVPTHVTPAPAVLVEDVPGESAARARKNLRRDMENQLAEGSREFLEALGEVDAVCLCFSHSSSCYRY